MAIAWLTEKLLDNNSYEKNKITTAEGKEVIVFSNVTKGAEDRAIAHLLREDIKGKIVILNKIDWINEFQQAGVKLYVGPGMNIIKHISEKLLNSLGIGVADWSLETENEAELLMITEHPIESAYKKDRKNKTYRIQQSPYGDKVYITNRKNLKKGVDTLIKCW